MLQAKDDIFSLIKWQFHGQFLKERLLMTGFALVAVGGTFLPVLNPKQDNLSKAIELGYGFVSSLAFTSSIYFRQRKEKIYKSVDDAALQVTKTTLKGSLILSNSIEEIAAKRNLLEHIKSLPEEEQGYWAATYGLQGLLNPPIQVQAQVEDRFALSGSAPESVQYSPSDTSPNPAWIYKLVEEMADADPEKRKHHHICINGGSQSGKSTLFSCVLSLLSKLVLESNNRVVVNLIDPKYPKTRWTIKPSFIGFDQVKEGIEYAIAELDSRKKQCIEAEVSGEQHPDFPRYILVVDEWDSIWGEGRGYGSTISKDEALDIRGNVLRILKEAAAYNLTLVIIGQSPLSKTNSFSRSDLNSATRIVIGNEALKWAQDPGFPFKAIAHDIQSSLNTWIEKGNRCALICPNIGQPFVHAIPKFTIEATSEVVSGSIADDGDWHDRLLEKAESLGRTPTKAEIKGFYKELMGEDLNAAQLKELMNYFEIVE